MKLNEPEKQCSTKAKFPALVKHETPYPDLSKALKGTAFDSSGFSADGTLISASMVHHDRVPPSNMDKG